MRANATYFKINFGEKLSDIESNFFGRNLNILQFPLKLLFSGENFWELLEISELLTRREVPGKSEMPLVRTILEGVEDLVKYFI